MTISDMRVNDVCCVQYKAPHRLGTDSTYIGTVVRVGRAGGGPIRPGIRSDSDDDYMTIELSDGTFRSFSQWKVSNITIWE